MANELIHRKGFISKSGSTVEAFLNVSGDTTSSSFITVGGSSTQFVKGDGTLDSNTYLTSVDLDGLGGNDYVTGATFNTGDGVITSTRFSGGTYTVDIDGRYTTAVTGGVGIDSTGGLTPSISLNLSELGVSTMVAGDWIAFDNAGTSNKALISSIDLGIFNNDQGWTSNVGTVTSVTAGAGMTQSGVSTVNPTLDVVGGTGIIANANDIELALQELSVTTVTGGDWLAFDDAGVSSKALISSIPLSVFDNDLSTVENTDDYVTGATFNTGDGVITSTLQSGGTYTVDIDGRYLTAISTATGLADTGGLTPAISLDFPSLPDGTGAIVGATDEIIYLDNGVESRKAVNEWDLGQFNNDQGWITNANLSGLYLPLSGGTLSGPLTSTTINVVNSLLDNQENLTVTTGTEVIATISQTLYDAGFFDYVVKNGTNVRSGTVMACHDGTLVEYTDTSTNDLGNTTQVTFNVDLSGGNMRLLADVDSGTWGIKIFIRGL